MATITEDYVSFETAKLLKEKEFDWGCISYYVDDEPDDIKYSFCGETNSTWESRCCSAPTLQTAMKWLRIEHGIHIEPHLVKTKRSYGYMPNYININDLTQHFPFKEIDFCDLEKYVCITYDKACELTLKYCLENLI